ncbi:aryl-sulfate sulfotransferase [Muricauda sp. CAU 1633]|uniref:arylsulfotransferase family protein n=1 Tax=Allomuricauda sp. CAU 1633 TaxID=2816036 RepID=UPI001A8EFDAB|nr:arylsulfotransferase family protein [Muricauda sp. CAU 1633]MBO0321713.1 aryl-sulfate sulfotransferase [Muricauda sp. CAU 1633]
MKRILFLPLLLLFGLVFFSCENNDNAPTTDDTSSDENPTDDIPVDDSSETGEKAGTVELLNTDLVYDGYILINDAGANRVYLMDKEATIAHEWELQSGIGNDVELLPNGQLLAILIADDPKIAYGGQGGKIQLINPDNSVEWNFDYSTEDYITHHDVELLPNGKILTIVWEKLSPADANQAGSSLEIDIFPEAIIEIDPITNEIIWEWHAWDHLIQDYDDTKDNYGSIADNPRLIDLNYVLDKEGDIMHANGIEYDEENELIYLSVNFYSEVWVIDHSTTTEEAASHSGGTYGVGGDLVYRFGNPEAYDNPLGERLFHQNHHPLLLSGDDLGKISIFSNGNDIMQSTAYEFILPSPLSLLANTDNEPTIDWSFTDPDLYSGKVSGMVRLPNGNRMITEGDFGVWEVTEAGEVVWKFSSQGFFWRAYHYDKDDSAIVPLGL